MKTSPADMDTVVAILKLVTLRYDVTLAEIESPSRSWRIVWPRFLAIYLARKLTRIPIVRIARLFDRDPAAVCNAIEKVENEMASYPKRKTEVRRLVEKFTV